MEFIVSFGAQYPREPHPRFPAADTGGYVTVTADTYVDARHLTVQHLGQAWCDIYPADGLRANPRFAEWFPHGEIGRITTDGATWAPACACTHAEERHDDESGCVECRCTAFVAPHGGHAVLPGRPDSWGPQHAPQADGAAPLDLPVTASGTAATSAVYDATAVYLQARVLDPWRLESWLTADDEGRR